jgi:sortase A
VRRVVGAVGRVFITAGLLILLFVAYQLWGTGLYTAREQDQLEQQFDAALSREDPGESSTTLPPPPPPEGEAVARIRIPKIGVDSIVVNGVSRDDLRKGPGHYPDTPLPGQEGNAAIAGHRTTYGAPFGNLDQLSEGDLIQVRTLQGSFEYRVREQLIVRPSDVAVIEPTPVDPNDPSEGFEPTLTLTTCNPKYSAAQRLVIKADLEDGEEAFPAPKILQDATITEEGLSGEEGSKLPAAIAGAIAAIIGLLWWLLFHRHPRWTSWLIGAIPFAVALFFFYSFLERVLPANY